MSANFIFHETKLPGLFTVSRKKIYDSRGFLSRIFCAEEFRQIGFVRAIEQINHTLTRKKGAVRGLHFQAPPFTESKLVSCIRGTIFDVAVDIRGSSPTFLHWHGEILSAENQTSVYIPDGFAHGFQALEGNCELVYLHSARYRPDAEGGLHVEDPFVKIEWPLDIVEMSERDHSHPMIDADFKGIDT